jgi:hypothetical protein
MAARALAVPAGLDALAVRVQPMTVRCDYKLGVEGHRMIGYLRGAQVIDTGWHSTPAKAATAYGRALGPLAAAAAARYLA